MFIFRFGFEKENSSVVLIQLLQLAMIVVRQKIEIAGLVDFFEHSLPKSFFEIAQWEVEVIDYY